MELSEIEEKISLLYERKLSLEKSRNISLIVAAVLIYNIYQANNSADLKWWFFAIMGLFVAVACGLSIKAIIQLKKIKEEMAELDRQKNEATE